jgi:ribosomal protein S12 methylthiotransferase accessory factor
MATTAELRDWIGVEGVCADAGRARPGATSCRVQAARATIRKAWALRGALGITRLADITELDRIGIPVIAASRPAVHDVQITATQGKGFTYTDAIASALLEAVERHAAASHRPSLLLATVAEVGGAGHAHLTPQELNAAPTGDARIDWIAATSLRTGREVLVPAAEVLYPYFPPAGAARPVRPSTTGLASGNSVAEAILHGLFEVLERDAVSCHALGRPAKLLDLDSLQAGSPERRLCQKFEDAGVSLFVLDLSEMSVVPAYKAITADSFPSGPRTFIHGQGAHVHPHIALRRALAEVAQSRAVAIQASREDLARYAGDWNPGYDVAASANLFREQTRRNGVSRLGAPTPDAFEGVGLMLRRVLARVAAAGFPDVLYTDLTDPQIKFPVVHVLVPGMMDVIVEPNRRRHVDKS